MVGLITLFLTMSVVFLQHPQLLAQQATVTSCDVPVVVADFYNKVVPDLQKADFSVRLAGTPAPVSNARIDTGPKRIVFIVDASSNVSDDEWKLEVETARSLTQDARPTDRLALLVIGADEIEHSFLAPEEIALQVNKLERSKGPEKTYDALLSALNILNSAQFGDAIFLIGHDEDFGSATTFREIHELMLKRDVRFYGMSFADKLAKLPSGFNLNKPLPSGFGLSKLELLSNETGYYFSFHAVRYVNMPGQEALFKDFLADLYTWIAQPYRLSFDDLTFKNRPAMEVNVAEMDARKIHKDGVHYPHFIPCAVAAGTLHSPNAPAPLD